MNQNDNSIQNDERSSELNSEAAELDWNASKQENNNPDENTEEAAAVEESMGVDNEIPDEVASINTDNETATEANQS